MQGVRGGGHLPAPAPEEQMQRVPHRGACVDIGQAGAELRVHGCAAQSAVGPKVEEFDGSYACLICSESVRGTDARKCLACASPGTRNARLR